MQAIEAVVPLPVTQTRVWQRPCPGPSENPLRSECRLTAQAIHARSRG